MSPSHLCLPPPPTTPIRPRLKKLSQTHTGPCDNFPSNLMFCVVKRPLILESEDIQCSTRFLFCYKSAFLSLICSFSTVLFPFHLPLRIHNSAAVHDKQLLSPTNKCSITSLSGPQQISQVHFLCRKKNWHLKVWCKAIYSVLQAMIHNNGVSCRRAVQTCFVHLQTQINQNKIRRQK